MLGPCLHVFFPLGWHQRSSRYLANFELRFFISPRNPSSAKPFNLFLKGELRKENQMKNAEVFLDGDMLLIKDKVVSLIGYGNQGQAQARILKSTGVRVVVGNIKDASWDQAVKDGFPVYNISEAVGRSDIALILIPDEVAPELYRKVIEGEIKKKEHFILCFASGYNIAFDFIRSPSNTDVIMVAPRMLGWGMLGLHEKGRGYPVLLGVKQDISGKAWEYAKTIAKGIGAIGLPGGVAVKSSFHEETLLDLLSEHTWAPILTAAIEAFFDVATEEYEASAEATLLELYASGELAEIAKLMAEKGIFEQLTMHSRTSQYGQLTRAKEFYDKIKEITKKEATDIRSGEFAKEWSLNQSTSGFMLNRMWKIARNSKLAKAEDKLYKILGRK